MKTIVNAQCSVIMSFGSFDWIFHISWNKSKTPAAFHEKSNSTLALTFQGQFLKFK